MSAYANGSLLFYCYRDLQRLVANEIIAPRIRSWPAGRLKTLFQTTQDHLESLKSRSEAISEKAAANDELYTVLRSVGFNTSAEIAKFHNERLDELIAGLRSLNGRLGDVTDLSESRLLYARLFWPLLFIQPDVSDPQAYTWPPDKRFLQESLAGSTSNTYLPTVLPQDLHGSLESLSGPTRTVFNLAHRPGEAGNSQALDLQKATAGVAAFDNRLIANYDDTSADLQAAFYDRIVGALSGIQVRIPIQTPDFHAAGLLVLCSPLKGFFHHLVHPLAATAASDRSIVIHDETATAPTEKTAPIDRWGESPSTTVRYAPHDDIAVTGLFKELQNVARRSGCFQHVQGLAEATIQDRRAREARQASEQREAAAVRVVSKRSVPHGALDSIEEIVGESVAVAKLKDDIRRLAMFQTDVLIVGKTGTGKQAVAKALHRLSGRYPFVFENLSKIPEGMFETRVFGHDKPLHTTSSQGKHIGLIEEANNGTLFLDEINSCPREHQTKLLGVLQPEGDDQVRVLKRADGTTMALNIRFLFATNEDLLTRVEDGSFRNDFYARIERPYITVPDLHERMEDIPLLANHFIKRHAKNVELTIASSVVDIFMQHSWPLQVRELEGVVKEAISRTIHRGSQLIEPQDIEQFKPKALSRPTASRSGTSLPSPATTESVGPMSTWESKAAIHKQLLASIDGGPQVDSTSRFTRVTAILSDPEDDRLKWPQLLKTTEAVDYLTNRHGVTRGRKKLEEYARDGRVKYRTANDGTGYWFFAADLDDLPEVLKQKETQRRDKARHQSRKS